jgi:predicted HTH domain antitoxin
MLNQIRIIYPDMLPDMLQKPRSEFEAEARMAMAVKLFEMKRISSGIAAKLAGIDRVSFLLNLHHFGVPMIDSEEEELLSDIQNA